MFKSIEDYIVVTLLDSADLSDPAVLARLNAQAERAILAQYKHPPRAILIESIEWVIATTPDDVERYQPAHDCAACRAGNDQARAFLAEFPDRRLAMSNLRYTEVWG